MNDLMMDMAGTVGRCDWCGRVDHHLVDGQCVACLPKLAEYRLINNGYKVYLTPSARPERRDQRQIAMRRLVVVGNLMAHALSDHLDSQLLTAFVVDRSLLESWEQALTDLRAALPQAQRNHALCERK